MYVLEAQTSLVQKRGEDSLTYLNKGKILRQQTDSAEYMILNQKK